MGREDKETPKDWLVRVGQEELGRIFHLRDSLEQSDALIRHAMFYRELGWPLALREVDGDDDSLLDFDLTPEVWGERLMTLALAGLHLCLAVQTGQPSGLLVLEVPQVNPALDHYGQWRSPCRAASEDGAELHFFALPPGMPAPSSGELTDFQVRVYGEDGWVLAPPSPCAGHGGVWNWLTPPWETAPGPPAPVLRKFLTDCGLLPETTGPPLQIMSWDQVYRQVASHPGLVQALLEPAVSLEAYYRNLVSLARQVGLQDQAVLLALLWHAPQGDAQTNPARLEFIQELLAAAGNGRAGQGRLPEPAATPLNVPPELAKATPPVTELVGFMENRVIMDRGRYDAMIHELGELSAKAAALERRLEEFERRWGEASPPYPGNGSGSAPLHHHRQIPGEGFAANPVRGWDSAPLSSLKNVVQEFLQNNADLAATQDSVQMLQFCLKNYIDLNPELGGLPLKRKLEMAGKMAREFLQQVGPRQQ